MALTSGLLCFLLLLRVGVAGGDISVLPDAAIGLLCPLCPLVVVLGGEEEAVSEVAAGLFLLAEAVPSFSFSLAVV